MFFESNTECEERKKVLPHSGTWLFAEFIPRRRSSSNHCWYTLCLVVSLHLVSWHYVDSFTHLAYGRASEWTFVLWHTKHYRLFKTKLYLHIYIKFIMCRQILLVTFLYETELIFFNTVKYFQVLLYNSHNLTLVICSPKLKWFQLFLFNTNYSVHHSFAQLNGSKNFYAS